MSRLVTELSNRALDYQLAEVSEIFSIADLWTELQVFAIRDYRRSGRGKAIRMFKLTRVKARQLKNLTDAQIALAVEKALMHTSALELSIFRIAQAKVENAAILPWNRWRHFVVTVTVSPHPSPMP